jgi:ribonucrease Y
MPDLIWIAAVVLAAALGGVVGYFARNKLVVRKAVLLEAEAQRRLTEARTKAMEVELGAKDKALKFLQEAEIENKRQLQELNRQDNRLQQRRENLDHRLDALEARERKLDERRRAMDARQSELDKASQKQLAELERISGLSREEAKVLLLKEVEADARIGAARIIREVEAEATQ